MRKVKSHLDLTVMMNKKGNKKCFYRYIINKRKTRENMGPL